MTRNIGQRLRLGLGVLLVLTCVDEAAGHFKFFSTENDVYRVELIRWERYGPGYDGVRFLLLVREKGTAAERVVLIENPTTGLEEAEIVDDTLILFGEVQSRARSVTLVNLASGQVRDFFRHWGVALSPSRRFLVFRAFYPPHGMVEVRSDVVRVYDIARSPAENRITGAREAVPGAYVGLPIYPPENVAPPTYRVWVPEETQRHYVDPTAGFLWTPDEKSLFFIDKTGGQTRLVRVSLEEGGRQPQIGTMPIDVAPVIAIEPQSPEYPKALARTRGGLAVIGLKLESDGRITLKLDPDLYRRKVYSVTELTVAPPEAAAPGEAAVEESPR